MIAGLSFLFLLAGVFFFIAGTAGLLRFPDLYARLHALTKADNLGIGLIAIGLVLRASTWAGRLQLLLIWLLVLVASATVCQILAQSALRRGIEPVLGDGWREP